MFREIILTIFRSTRLCVTVCGIMHRRFCRPPASNKQRLFLYIELSKSGSTRLSNVVLFPTGLCFLKVFRPGTFVLLVGEKYRWGWVRNIGGMTPIRQAELFWEKHVSVPLCPLTWYRNLVFRGERQESDRTSKWHDQLIGFVIETECVFCAVWTAFHNSLHVNFLLVRG